MIKYVIAIIIGIILTLLAIENIGIERGYNAIGGEYLIIPMMLLLTFILKSMKKELSEVISIILERK